MKIIDIRTKNIPDEERLKDSRVGFHLDVKGLPAAQARQLPHYEIELGKHEKTTGWFTWFRGWKQVSVAFTTHFGLKRYRVKTWFMISCFLLLALMETLPIANSALNLISSGKQLAHHASAQNLFAASLALKETNKSLATLGEIPKRLSDKFQALNIGSAWAEFFLRTAGFYNPRSYLVLFENNAEIRATGGFIGSYALINVDEGKIEIKKLEGIYNVSGQQRVRVVPPLPIQKVSQSWMFHDANWFFDFPTSAKAVMWFYEKSGGPTVDGVIALTPEVITRLLEYTGPIRLPKFGVTISKDSFIDTIQYEVETKYKARGLADPKEILSHLAPGLLKKVETLPRQTLANLALDSLLQKAILFYFDRPEEEAFMNYLHWGGAVAGLPGDYLAVVNTNINGFKTDRFIRQHVSLARAIDENGDIIDTLSITREHKGGSQPYSWYNKVNADYLRVYVPQGSTLLEVHGQTKEAFSRTRDYPALGFLQYPELAKTMASVRTDEDTTTSVWQESGKTVFGNWMYVSPQERATITYRYKLPFGAHTDTASVNAPLTVQKQPGITYTFTHSLDTPSNWKLLWQSPQQEFLTHDTLYDAVFSVQ